MNKEVRIKVTGISDTGNMSEMPDYTESEALGNYGFVNGKHMVSYEETDEETGAPLKTLVKFDDEIIEVIRKGSIESKLVFKKDDRYDTVYSTSYGGFSMSTITESFKKVEEDKKIDLHVTYDLEINQEFVSKNSIVISITFI